MSEEKLNENGGISVDTGHIFPVIKRWLYSDKEIFLREIVSNASDAITKMKRLCSLGEAQTECSGRIDIAVDKDEGTLTVSDDGIGMSADEVRRYICQIALSGALEFIEKYEGEGQSDSGIIGHFGLGFYSAFMVAERVDVLTKSYTDAPAVFFSCDESGSYNLTDGERTERGTDVIMHISADESEFLEKERIKALLGKYCSFLPYPVFFDGEQINDTEPLWQKRAQDCTEEEYREFYTKVFGDCKQTLFHIHLNADYPLNFKGILYFPKINPALEGVEGQVKLYYNQMFVADNVKEIIPDYLLMLKGVLDCPELPLNVSRSYLQTNTYVTKLSAHIVKKVADKISSMFGNDREYFEKIWDDLKLFFEFACLRDKKFFDKVSACTLYKCTDGGYLTLDEYLEKTGGKCVRYTTDPTVQSKYVSMYTSQGMPVAVLDHPLDAQFISLIEEEKKVEFLRVDADMSSLSDGDKEDAPEELAELFRKASGKENLSVEMRALKDEKTPALIASAEQTRRMQDMMRAYGMEGLSEGGEDILVLNSRSPLIEKLRNCAEPLPAARQIWALCLLSVRPLSADELAEFISQSYDGIERGLSQ